MAHSAPDKEPTEKVETVTVSKEKEITYLTLYRYATRLDLLIVALSGFCAIVSGVLVPVMPVRFLFL
jgi:hypothetical protein